MADDTLVPDPGAADDAKLKSGAAKARAKTEGATATFKEEARKATESARNVIKDSTQKLSAQAGDKARGLAEDGKLRASTALDELAKMMTEAAGSVDERLGKQYGDYARSAATAVQGFSSNLQAKEVDDLIDDARSFVKKSPAVAIGTAAAVGFVVARLVMAGIDANKTKA